MKKTSEYILNKKNILFLFLFICYIVLIIISFNKHSKKDIYTYKSELWADKAGYYMFLPATFIYKFDVSKAMQDIDKKTGYGFFIENNKFVTKYTYGVALLQSPFFIVAHILAKPLGYENNGFSLIYNRLINISAITYTFLAFVLLFNFLKRYIEPLIAFLSISIIYLGTNLFYYSVIDTGMSHIYSFFLFSAFLNLSKYVANISGNFLYYILYGIVIGLILVIRPTNILFFLSFFFFNKINFMLYKKYFFIILALIAIALLVFIPQFFYWKYAFESYVYYSYGNETFKYLFNPKILLLWFSTNNGLFIYSPLVIFVILGIFFVNIFSSTHKLFFLLYFVLISAIFASWYSWNYGCSYGSRPFVEYYSLFAFPFSFLLKHVYNNKLYTKILYSLMFILIIAYNQKLIFSYNVCWFGGNWDFSSLFDLLFS